MRNDSRTRPYFSLLYQLARNNLGTALFQMGEHTLAKVEHRTVLALLEAGKKRPSEQQDGASGEFDIYVDTLVNLHR